MVPYMIVYWNAVGNIKIKLLTVLFCTPQ